MCRSQHWIGFSEHVFCEVYVKFNSLNAYFLIVLILSIPLILLCSLICQQFNVTGAV